MNVLNRDLNAYKEIYPDKVDTIEILEDRWDDLRIMVSRSVTKGNFLLSDRDMILATYYEKPNEEETYYLS